MEIVRTERRTRPLSLTPLIDVVFLLVVFFMLSTTFIQIESIELGLPSDDKSKALADNSTLYIDIASNGSVYWRGRMMLPFSLKQRIATKIKENSERHIVVRVGKEVSVQKLVSVMDIIYLNGGKNVSVDSWDEEEIKHRLKIGAEEMGDDVLREEENAIPALDEADIPEPKAPISDPQKALDDMLGF